MNANAAVKLKKARAGLILDHPFFGALSMRLVLREDGRLATGAVDGKSIRYNPTWIEGLTLAQTKGFLAHEVLHVAAGHCWRRDAREMERWNIATDYAINSIVADAGMELPDGRLLDPFLNRQAAEDIYHKLPERGDGGNGPTAGQGDAGDDDQPGAAKGGQDDDSDDSQDGDESPENGASGDSEADAEPDQDDRDGQGGQSDGDEDDSGADGDGDGESDQDDGNVPDPGGCGAVEDADPTSDLEGLQREWKIATQQAAQAAKSMGNMPGDLERLVDTIVDPEVPWTVLLRDFVVYAARNDYNWSVPNRRHIARGIILPGIRSSELPPIVIAVDTSGSIGADELAAFEAEVGAILEDFDTTLHVVYCDTEVTYAEDLTRADVPVKLTPRGGGGTDFRPVFDHVEAEDLQPAALIYLTDLYGRLPEREPDYPVLWVCTTDEVAPWGQTAKLTVQP